MRRFPLLFCLAAVAPLAAQGPAGRNMIVLVTETQELDVFSPEDMAKRSEGGVDRRFVAADQALNTWKTCVTGAIARWQPLHQGPGTLADAAFGHCAGLSRAYRLQLLAMTQDGRAVMDPQMARAMTRSLEETWRPRLTALALDQDLASLQPVEKP